MDKRFLVVFSGYNQRAVVSFLRTLVSFDLDFVIFARDESDPILETEYAKYVSDIRSTKALDITWILETIIRVKKEKGLQEAIIAPSTEALNRYMNDHRSVLEDQDIIVPIVHEELYNIISDKYSFGTLCERHGIVIPREFSRLDRRDIPFVAKPRKYMDEDGNTASPILILTDHDFNQFEENENTDHFYFQEFVEGRSVYLLYYISTEGVVYKMSQENYVQQPHGKSILAAKTSDVHLSSISVNYEKMLLSSGYHGLIMIEIKLENDRDVMIEANPRFWGPSQLFVDSGYNLFSAFLEDYGLIHDAKFGSESIVESFYFWFGGLQKVIAANDRPVYHNYNEEAFLEQFKRWMNNDVYNRMDTNKIFKKELYGEH